MDVDLGASLSCFVIGPIGDRLQPADHPDRRRYDAAQEVLVSVIQPACRANGLNPLRADQIARPGEITEQVFRAVRDADVVIADVTDGNPNVMYELGLRHTRNAITIHVGERGRLPFDISAVRTIPFARNRESLIEAKDQLQAAFKTGLKGQFDPVTATRLWVEIGAARRRVELKDVGPGRLERVPEMKAAIGRLRTSFGAIGGDITKQLADAMSRLVREKDKLDSANATWPEYQPIIHETADLLGELADRADEMWASFAADTRLVALGLDHLLDKFTRNPRDPEIPESAWIIAFITDLQNAVREVASHAQRAHRAAALHHLFKDPVERIVSVFEQLPEPLRPLSNHRARLAAIIGTAT